jgi:hypothetical protein
MLRGFEMLRLFGLPLYLALTSLQPSLHRSWIAHGLLMVGSWMAHGWLMDGSWMAHGLLMDCSWIAHGWLKDCSWMAHGWLMDGSWMAHGWLMDGSWMAHGLLMGVKGAMIVGTRKDADLKQPSCVSFVNCNILHCLQLRSPGPRANASGNGTWSRRG